VAASAETARISKKRDLECVNRDLEYIKGKREKEIIKGGGKKNLISRDSSWPTAMAMR
jgi:hypothetical protein